MCLVWRSRSRNEVELLQDCLLFGSTFSQLDEEVLVTLLSSSVPFLVFAIESFEADSTQLTFFKTLILGFGSSVKELFGFDGCTI